jgi:hypothetical protein
MPRVKTPSRECVERQLETPAGLTMAQIAAACELSIQECNDILQRLDTETAGFVSVPGAKRPVRLYRSAKVVQMPIWIPQAA